MAEGIRVTAVDLETGDSSEIVVEPGNYTIIAVHPCRLDGVQNYANGTTVLTLKGRSPNLMAVQDVTPGGAGDG